MMSSNECQHHEVKGGDCTFLNDRPQIRRNTDAPTVQLDCVHICKTSPLLLELLVGDELKDLSGSLTSSVEKGDAITFKSNNPSAKHTKQKGATVMISSSCGQTRAKAQHPSATHSGYFQPMDIFSTTVRDGLPSNAPMYRTNAEVLKLINERIAFFRARRRKPDHNKPKSSSVPCHSTTFSSDNKKATTHTISCSLDKQGSILAGQAFEVDRLKGQQTTIKSTRTSDSNGKISHLKQSNVVVASSGEVGPNKIIHKSITGCQTATNNQESASLDKENVSLNVTFSLSGDVSKTEDPARQRRKRKEMQVSALFGDISHKHSEVTTTTSVEVTSNKTVDTHVFADVEFPEQPNDQSKSVSSDNCDIETLSSERVNNKELMDVTNVNPVGHSLSELRELVATLDNEVTDAQMDDVSEVLLRQYWNGDRANIHAFESNEYPQIMLEVAATCTQLECPVTKTMFSRPSSPCSNLPQEHLASWINIEKNLTGREPVCDVSYVTKLTGAEDQGNTGTKPGDVSTVENGTNWSVAQYAGEQGVNANKQKDTQGLQSSKTTTKEVNSNVKQNSINTVSSVNLPLMDNQKEQLLSRSNSHGDGEAVRNDQEATTLDTTLAAMSLPDVPQYEDVSDAEDPVQQHREHKESEFAAFFEDISDEENMPTANTLVEAVTHPSEGSLPKNKSLVQMEPTSDGKVIQEVPQNCYCPYYVETVTGFEQVLCSKCDDQRLLGMQTSESQNPPIVLNKNDESDNEVDDWFVMPLKIDDITVHDQVESDNGEQIGTPYQDTVLGSPLCAVPTTQPGNGSVITLQGSPLETEIDVNHISRHPSCESDDSCETEDSCDYMPTQARNYLTVSRQAWNNLPSPSPSDQEGQRTCYPLNNETKETSLTRSSQSIVGSDSEDENDSGTKTIQKSKKLISPQSYGIGATSFLCDRRHTSVKDGHCETEELTPEHLSTYPQELSFKHLAKDRTEVMLDTKTEDRLDGVNGKNARKSNTSDSVGDDSAEAMKPKESVHQLKNNPQPKSQIGQSKGGHVLSPEPPQNKNTQQGLKLMNAKVQTGPAQLETNPEITLKGNRAASKSKTRKKLKGKVRRPARIYSDTSETEDGEAFSDVSDCLQVNKHKNTGLLNERKDGIHNVQPKENWLTSTRMNPEDSLEKGHVNKKAKISLSETEDSEDNFSDTPGTSTLQTQKRFSSKDQPSKHSSKSRIVNRLYVQESLQSNEFLKLSKDFPVQNPNSDEQPHVNANTNAATTKRVNLQTSNWNTEKEERISSKSKPFPISKAGTSALKQHVPAARQPSSHSNISPTTSGLPRPFSKINSTPPSARPSALEKVKGIWKDQFYPVSVHKKSGFLREDNTKNKDNSIRETESRPKNHSKMHRRKHRAKSETPLMKKTKSEAKERTRDIKSNQQRRHSYNVSDHYKWKDKREGLECSDSRKRSVRCSSSPDLDWD